MISITERFRKVLRTVFRGIGVSVISLIIQACYGVMYPDEPAAYGMPPPAYGPLPVEEVSISGKVVAKETGKPIFGIQVSVEETELSKRTDENGFFNLIAPIQELYKLKFEDVDGPYNDGLFKQQIFPLKQEETYKYLLIGMDIDTKTDEE